MPEEDPRLLHVRALLAEVKSSVEEMTGLLATEARQEIYATFVGLIPD